MEAIKKTSEQWQELCRITVLDPDGWDRKNFYFSWYQELITREEFEWRLCRSTVKCNSTVDIWEDIQNQEITHGIRRVFINPPDIPCVYPVNIYEAMIGKMMPVYYNDDYDKFLGVMYIRAEGKMVLAEMMIIKSQAIRFGIAGQLTETGLHWSSSGFSFKSGGKL